MIQYKIDVLAALKEKGFSTYKLRKDRLLSESTVQAFRSGSVSIALDNIDRVCKLLDCQPGDLVEYVADAGEGDAECQRFQDSMGL